MASQSTMQAVAYTGYGGPEVTKLMSVRMPTAGPNEILIKVAAGGMNPVDAIQRSGKLKMITPYKFPQVAGNELSGTVTAIGEGVTTFAVGDKVIARSDKHSLDSFAEYAAMDASVFSHAPKSIPLTDAAGLPLAGLTAYQCLDRLEVAKGERLLITGGAGGVGLITIALAKLRGAHVTTTASSAGRPGVLKAGADAVIDYKTTSLTQAVASGEYQPFDKVFDLVGGDEAAMAEVFAATKTGGKVVTVAGPPTPDAMDDYVSGIKWFVVSSLLSWQSRGVRAQAAARNIDYAFVFMRPDGKQLQLLADLVDEGKISVVIDSRFPSADFAKAYERLESRRSKGKVLIEFE